MRNIIAKGKPAKQQTSWKWLRTLQTTCTVCHLVILGQFYITAWMSTTTERRILFRDIHWKPCADNTVTVSKQTEKVPDFPSIRGAR